jgi:DNA topoisomerase I
MELIIAEKPSAAFKIATALADGKAIKESINGVPHYQVTHGNNDIIVTCAVGHLYTVAEREKGQWTYPVFDVEWKASHQVNKASSFTSKYLTAIKRLAKQCDTFTVACDFDIEGSVIGANIIKHACKKKDGNRMKFSTVTRADLIKAYETKMKHLDWGQVNAGLTRHELDYYYGINISRALTLSVKHATGGYKLLTSGRVQGPALKIVVDKEREIQAFIPDPYRELELLSLVDKTELKALHEKDKFFNLEEAEKIYNKVKDEKQSKVKDLDKKQFKQQPPVPFDLTTLQTEAYRSMRISPKETLALAQDLYLKGVISYPRTSSQQLPKEIGFTKILNGIKNNPKYAVLAELLLKKPKLEPNNGKKKDPAHPAIYPTGEIAEISEREYKIYDIIVRRFMATFGDPAVRETVKIFLDILEEIFISKGTRTVEKGWHEFYGPHVKIEEEELPAVDIGQILPVKKLSMYDKQTQPPKRYTPASIIKALEKKGLGTKATRSTIVENLFDRGYVHGKSIEATKLGIRTIEILEKYCPKILDDALTRHFEDEMELIVDNKKESDAVLGDARQVLTKILEEFKKKEMDIGKELSEANVEARDEMAYVGKCLKCKEGDLQLRRGKFGQFIACSKYPDCKTTFSVPNNALVKPADKTCEVCGYPIVLLIRRAKKPQEACINPDCKSKVSEEDQEALKKAEDKKCPNCGKDMVLRKSMYGAFYGCSGYPKCKTIIQLDGTVQDYNNKKPAAKKTTKRKTTKRKTVKRKTTKKKK